VPVASSAFIRRFARHLLDSFAYLGIPIFQRALLAGCVLAALLALLGVLVTARGLAYLGDGLSHAAFGGIALGMFLGLSSPLTIAIPFTALAAMAIGAMRRRGGLRSDVAMAILFAVCFAAGIVLLRKAKRTEQTFDPEQLLFGNILLVGADDLWIVLGIAAVTVGFVAFAWTRIAYATFDEELARLSGIEVGWLESALLALLAAVVVAAIRLAGVVLVSAFLVIPAAAGRLIGRSLTGVVGWAMLMGVLGVSLGFVVAHRLEWPEGAAIVLLLAAIFAAAAGWRRLRA
jgi:zinc transport system permease protein